MTILLSFLLCINLSSCTNKTTKRIKLNNEWIELYINRLPSPVKLEFVNDEIFSLKDFATFKGSDQYTLIIKDWKWDVHEIIFEDDITWGLLFLKYLEWNLEHGTVLK